MTAPYADIPQSFSQWPDYFILSFFECLKEIRIKILFNEIIDLNFDLNFQGKEFIDCTMLVKVWSTLHICSMQFQNKLQNNIRLEISETTISRNS